MATHPRSYKGRYCYVRPVADSSFDLLVDKAMLDAISCVSPAENMRLSMAETVDGCQRVLREGGSWVVLSFNAPAILLPHLEGAGDMRWRTGNVGRLHLYEGRKECVSGKVEECEVMIELRDGVVA